MIATSNGSGDGTLYSYSPYGEPDATRGWTGSRFRYTGQIMLPEAQLYHYKARVYDPSLGRFLQTDPVGYESDLNLYEYVRSDPINLIDPLGFEEECNDPRGCEKEDASEDDEEEENQDEEETAEEIVVTAQRVVRAMCDAGLPAPDFVMAEFSVPLPEFPFVGGGGFGIVDRFGQVYGGPQAGAGFPSGGGYHGWAGWMGQGGATAAQMRGFLTEGAVQFSVVGPPVGPLPPMGVQFMGNNSGTAFLVGSGTPGLSLQGSWSWQLYSTKGELWSRC